MQGSGFRVQDSGCRVQGVGFRVQGAGCRFQGSGFRVQGSGCRVEEGASDIPALLGEGVLQRGQHLPERVKVQSFPGYT